MKLVISKPGEYQSVPSEKPEREPGKVLFHVKAVGICGSDIPRIFAGKSYYYPIVLGHEFSGIVEDAEDSELVGRRAVVFPIIPCGKCDFCRAKKYANCINYSYYGSRTDGGMQSYLNIDPFNIITFPDKIPFDAAAMTEPSAVCLHAVKKGNINSGSNVKVYGAGTIGMLIAMWASAKGAKTVAVTDIDPQRKAFAEKLGFLTECDNQPDVIFDATGSGNAVSQAIDEIAPFGRMILVGNASSDVNLPVAIYSKILRKQLAIFGSWNSDFSPEANDWKESLQAMENGIIRPELLITSKYPLSEGAMALDRIRDRKFDMKIIIGCDG